MHQPSCSGMVFGRRWTSKHPEKDAEWLRQRQDRSRPWVARILDYYHREIVYQANSQSVRTDSNNAEKTRGINPSHIPRLYGAHLGSSPGRGTKNPRRGGVFMLDYIVFILVICGIVLVPIAMCRIKKRYLWALRYDNHVDLSFDQFLEFWRVNPENWILGYCFLDYRRPARDDCDIVVKHFSIRLPRKDIPRYKKFFLDRRAQEILADRNKITTDFIRCVQEDLNKFAAQSPVFDVKNSENPMDAVKTSPLPRGFG